MEKKMEHLPSFTRTGGKWAIWNWAEKDEQLSEENVEATSSLSTAFQPGAQLGQRGPVRIAADEAEVLWINVSEGDIDKCFPGLTKWAPADVLFSAQEGCCGAEPLPKQCTQPVDQEMSICFRKTILKKVLAVSAPHEEQSPHFRAALGSSLRASKGHRDPGAGFTHGAAPKIHPCCLANSSFIWINKNSWARASSLSRYQGPALSATTNIEASSMRPSRIGMDAKLPLTPEHIWCLV